MFIWTDEDTKTAIPNIEMKLRFIKICMDNGHNDIALRETLVLQNAIGVTPIICALREELQKRHIAEHVDHSAPNSSI